MTVLLWSRVSWEALGTARALGASAREQALAAGGRGRPPP
jgi:hypothetical protein